MFFAKQKLSFLKKYLSIDSLQFIYEHIVMIKKTESFKAPPSNRQTQYYRTADAIRSDGERNLIGRRTQSDRTANAI